MLTLNTCTPQQGTTSCTIEGQNCHIVSSVVLPNGKERVVAMSGSLSPEGGILLLQPTEGLHSGPSLHCTSSLPPQWIFSDGYRMGVVCRDTSIWLQGLREIVPGVAGR